MKNNAKYGVSELLHDLCVSCELNESVQRIVLRYKSSKDCT